MFNFLKDKLKDAVDKVGEKIKKEEEPIEDTPIVKEKVKEKKEEVKKEFEKEKLHEEIEDKGFLKQIKEKVTTKKISEEKFEDLFQDLELALLENNVAVEVIDKIKSDLKNDLVDNPLSRKNIEEQIKTSLNKSISSLFGNFPDILDKINKKPFVICFVGINGSGKTTNLAKVTNYLQKNKKSCVLAAADTFRAASIEQLQIHADKLDVKLIKHTYGSDPAAVAFDAIKYAKANDIDVVLIDTSGRLHSNENLMAELKKITRVADPDLTIFVGEAITGNDAVEQAKTFNEQIGLDGIILSKQDIDEKGGAAISISYITKLPILFIGVGQELDDLEQFNKDKILQQLGLE
ncbi:MAG: signal recognition particle-docking protein FtsY [Nanoarchaeota archaeon]|nr:signal recognition particle-docking protein FtsY [Nanoarchaeota archaeon]